MEIRESIKNLIDLPKSHALAASAADEEDMIAVSAATKRIASAYEKFRNVLEPDEEDILRRKSIRRVLERRIWEDKNPQIVATSILQELIRARYIPSISKIYIGKVAAIISVVSAILPHVPEKMGQEFLDIVAISVDRLLYPRAVEEAMVDLMYHDVYQRIVWADDLMEEKDRPAQVYIACHRALFAAEEAEIKYHFFRNQFPIWRSAPEGVIKQQEINELIKHLPSYMSTLNVLMNNEGRERLLRILRPASVPYRIVLDMINQQKEEWKDQETMEVAARKALEKRTEHIQKRISRRAWHSILFLFFTKTLVAFFVELPYELFLLGQIHWLAVISNIVFHPFLLFVASVSVRMPGASNAEKVVEQSQKIMIADEVLPTILVDKPRRYGILTWTLFASFYTALFMFMFWRAFLFLDDLQFSLPAILIFVAFLGLVSFLATRIRRSVDDIRLLPKREGAFGLLFSFISLPFLEFGRWLTTHISQLNLMLFVMDLILEAPFKVAIDIIEEWFGFIRERKEEII